MKKKEVIRKVVKVSDGLFGTVIDLILFQFFVLGSSIGTGKTSRGAYKAIWEANDSLCDFNYQTIKQGIAYLKRKGLIRLLKKPGITYAGKERLENIFPVYDKDRVWDKYIYLVTYDISEKSKNLRDKLRNYLKTIGAGLLQKSVWVTVYNPEDIIKEFVEKENIKGEIIVSCVGKNGYIGDESLKELLIRVFKLDEINEKYEGFIFKYPSEKKALKTQIAMSFLSILKDDPQLPFELLPENWVGDRAYRIFDKLVYG